MLAIGVIKWASDFGPVVLRGLSQWFTVADPGFWKNYNSEYRF